MAYYVCADLHGYSLKKFQAFLRRVGFRQSDFLYILGDVIDRGPDGVKILDWLLYASNAQLLLGNHEAMMLSCCFLFDTITEETVKNLTPTQMAYLTNWVENGGQCTIDALSSMDKEEIGYLVEYLQEAPLYELLTVNDRDFILTHAGLGNFRKKKKLSDYTADELLWERPKLDQKYFDDVTVVFGHTPTFAYGDAYEGKPIVTPTWINIDVGAGYDLPAMLLRLDDMQMFFDTP